MKTHINIIILAIFISSCCSYDNKDFDFNSEELNHFSHYKLNDTIYFKSNLGDWDTITVVGFGTEIKKECGGVMSLPPVNGRCVQIKLASLKPLYLFDYQSFKYAFA